MSVAVKNLTHSRKPRVAWKKLAWRVLGKAYHLSVVLCTDKLARRLNKKYRNKNKAANVLSFPLDKREGEIFLNIQAAKREAKEYDRTAHEHLVMLYIHGLCHLKGLPHGRRMEQLEQKLSRAHRA